MTAAVRRPPALHYETIDVTGNVKNVCTKCKAMSQPGLLGGLPTDVITEPAQYKPPSRISFRWGETGDNGATPSPQPSPQRGEGVRHARNGIPSPLWGEGEGEGVALTLHLDARRIAQSFGVKRDPFVELLHAPYN